MNRQEALLGTKPKRQTYLANNKKEYVISCIKKAMEMGETVCYIRANPNYVIWYTDTDEVVRYLRSLDYRVRVTFDDAFDVVIIVMWGETIFEKISKWFSSNFTKNK